MFVPDLNQLIARPASPLQNVLINFEADWTALLRRYPISCSPATRQAFLDFCAEWEREADRLAYEALSHTGQIDWHLLVRRIRGGRLIQETSRRLFEEARPLLPFADAIIEVEENRIAVLRMDPRETATRLDAATRATRRYLENTSKADVPPLIAASAARMAEELKKCLENWRTERLGYDPLLTWWAEKPCDQLTAAVADCIRFFKEEVCGEKEDRPAPIHHTPLGRDFIVRALENEWIAYAPEELYAMAEEALVWCEKEMEGVFETMGCGKNRAAAIEQMKNYHAAPGEQPYLARELAEEAVAFIEERGLLTIPAHAKRVWRQQMITPEQQKNSPFLWGGETIGTSYSHQSMTHAQKLTSMRSNCVPFMRATVHHELIPGHHLKMYMEQRSHPQRQGFGTPFCGEGWPLYWELRLYDLELPPTPADRLGFLFWRMHRCARIMVVLGFHIGRLSIPECLDLIIRRVGHEEAGGTSQVRWLTSGGYFPLYGAAYMLGAMQLMGLRRELVDSGKMGEREFHDAVLAENTIPIELLRAALTGLPLSRDQKPAWRFNEG